MNLHEINTKLAALNGEIARMEQEIAGQQRSLHELQIRRISLLNACEMYTRNADSLEKLSTTELSGLQIAIQQMIRERKLEAARVVQTVSREKTPEVETVVPAAAKRQSVIRPLVLPPPEGK